MAGILLLSGKVPALLFDYFKTWGQNTPVYFWGVQRVMLMHTAPLSEARCSKDSDKGVLCVRQRSKAYILVCIASKAASLLLLA